MLGLIAVSVLFLSLFVRAGNGVYFRFRSKLDLRNKTIQTETYHTLSRKMPNCDIVWNVPFQGGAVSSDTATRA